MEQDKNARLPLNAGSAKERRRLQNRIAQQKYRDKKAQKRCHTLTLARKEPKVAIISMARYSTPAAERVNHEPFFTTGQSTSSPTMTTSSHVTIGPAGEIDMITSEAGQFPDPGAHAVRSAADQLLVASSSIDLPPVVDTSGPASAGGGSASACFLTKLGGWSFPSSASTAVGSPMTGSSQNPHGLQGVMSHALPSTYAVPGSYQGPTSMQRTSNVGDAPVAAGDLGATNHQPGFSAGNLAHFDAASLSSPLIASPLPLALDNSFPAVASPVPAANAGFQRTFLQTMLGASPKDMASMIRLAAQEGYTPTLRSLIHDYAIIHGSMAEALDSADEETGMAALHLAAMNKERDTAEILVDEGASLHVKDKDGKTPT